ncbi:hypothetical protein TNCV_1614231 [Trichonephila clavipes]|nr:hypothetical protein TNCV_1614231 [Trichonephila clavipes]
MVMKKRINAIEKSFLSVLLLLHITGLEDYPNGVFLKKTGLRRIIWKIPKYLFRLLQCLAILTEALYLVMLPEKKKAIAVFILVLLQLIVNLQTWRSHGYLYAFFGEIGIPVPVCLVILSASAANQAFFTAKEALQSLPWKIPQYRDKLKEMIRSQCMRSASLTLWKVYKIEPSLILSAMGTLVTYGMLMATLGGIK